jgi:putative membrane protein
MKKSTLILFIAAGAYFAQSCNSNNRSADDTVEYAEEQNEEMQEDATLFEFDNSEFAVEAANGGLTEIRASKIAQQKAQNQSVKDFAAMIIEDHTKANEELTSLAANKNITLPNAPGEDKLEQIADLNSETGADFDSEYMDMMVNDHQNDIDLFEDASENSEDAEIRAFADKTLPVLRKHLEEAESIQESLE